MINRIGTFCILLGLFLIGMYILSDIARQASCNLLLFGAVFFGTGVFLWSKDPPEKSPPPERFRLLKKMESQPRRRRRE